VSFPSGRRWHRLGRLIIEKLNRDVVGIGHDVLLFRQMPLSGESVRKIDQSMDLIERDLVRSSTNIGAASKDQ